MKFAVRAGNRQVDDGGHHRPAVTIGPERFADGRHGLARRDGPADRGFIDERQVHGGIVLRRAAFGLAIGLASAILVWALGLTTFVETIELETYDLRIRQMADPAEARQDIVLVTIDDGSIRRLEEHAGRWPWPRVVHGLVIDYLARAEAKLIVYDVLFTERDRRTFEMGGETWSGEESDRALAESVARAGNVVVAADVSAGETAQLGTKPVDRLMAGQPFPADPAFEPRPALVLPYDELTDAALAVGHSLTILDADGPVRRSVPFVRVAGAGLPSLGLVSAMHAAGWQPSGIVRRGDDLLVGDSRMPLVPAVIPSFDGPAIEAKRALIRYTGPAFSGEKTTYREFSFFDLYYSEEQILAGEQPVIAPSVFKDAIVIVGTTAAGLSDLFTTPFARGKMPGAQVHANVIDNVLSGRFMDRAGWMINAGVVLVCAVAVGLLGVRMSVWWTLGVATVLAGTLAAIGLALFRHGLWIDMAQPALALATAAFGTTAYQYFVEGREKRQVKHVFSRFVSRDVYTQLMADPSRARLGGARRDMTVLFADIRGFTSFTEAGRAEDIVAQLNEYFSRMVAVVLLHRGTVDKFVGDMIMALYGAPLEDADHADHAVETALGMLDELDRLNQQWAAVGRPGLEIGIGINTGDMLAGNIGSESVMSYTVIGDAVNLGARLESLNKEYGTSILISDATRQRLRGRYDMRSLGTVVVKGKTEAVEIWQVQRRDPGRPRVPPQTSPSLEG